MTQNLTFVIKDNMFCMIGIVYNIFTKVSFNIAYIYKYTYMCVYLHTFTYLTHTHTHVTTTY